MHCLKITEAELSGLGRGVALRRAAAAQRFDPSVIDAGLRRRQGESVPVELRELPGAGESADVGDDLHVVSTVQSDELFERVPRVADGEEFMRHGVVESPKKSA
jgi:hypothetical protein